MSIGRRLLMRPDVVVIVVGYFVLSTACLATTTVPQLLVLAQSNTGLLWLLGPPALLIYGKSFLWLYAIGSTAVGALVWGAFAVGRWSVWSVVLGTLALFLWLGMGLLVYVPAW